MSLEAKKDYIDEVSVKLEDELTVTKMRTVQKAMIETFDGYTLEHDTSGDNIQQSKELMDIYIKAKLTEGKSKKTMALYKRRVESLLKYTGVQLRNISTDNIRDWFDYEQKRGINNSTIKGYRFTFSSVFGWLYKEELITRNPCNNLAPIKERKVLRYPFSDAELEMLKENCNGVRNKAIISFLLATGARIGEVCALNREDINFQDMEVKVLGKGNKERTVYMDPVATMNLKRYFESRKDNNPALFVGKRHNRFTEDGIRKMLVKLGNAAGVQNVHPHRFRRTLATILYCHGMSIQEIAKILGHEKIDTTMGYIHINQNNVKASYRRFF